MTASRRRPRNHPEIDFGKLKICRHKARTRRGVADSGPGDVQMWQGKARLHITRTPRPTFFHCRVVLVGGVRECIVLVSEISSQGSSRTMSCSTTEKLRRVPSDEDLMIAASGGNIAAYGELVERHQSSAWNAAYRFLGDRT